MVASLHEIGLVHKVADRVLCIDTDGHVAAQESPEDALTARSTADLLGMARGTFDPLLGGMEFPPAQGAPRVLVLAHGADAVGGRGAGSLARVSAAAETSSGATRPARAGIRGPP